MMGPNPERLLLIPGGLPRFLLGGALDDPARRVLSGRNGDTNVFAKELFKASLRERWAADDARY